MKKPFLRVMGLCMSGALAAGCGGGTGTVEVWVSGEEAATMGYPVGDIAFADGWTVQFEHLFVSVQDFALVEGGQTLTLEAESTVVDLTAGDQPLWSFPGVPAQRWSDVGYRLALPTTSSRRLGSVAVSDVQAMVEGGLSFRMVGTATHPTHGSVRIDLGLPLEVRMERCVSGRDGTDGLVVPASGTHTTQLTLHLDHLFFDSARAEEPSLRFDAWAAVAGGDRTVTYADLAGQSLADLRGIDGMPLVDELGVPIAYEPPSTGLPMQTLQAFVLAEAATIGHFEGEGHCDYQLR